MKLKNATPTMWNLENVSEMISLYELMPFGLLLLAAATQSPFLAILALATLSKQLPEKLLKRMPFPKTLSARPSRANNCNVINKGGSYTNKPGFPSGHTTTAWFLMFYFLQQSVYNPKLFGPFIVTAIYAVLIPIARVALSCHTIQQIYGGMLLGIVWAKLFMVAEEKYLMKYTWYANDRKRMFDTFKWSGPKLSHTQNNALAASVLILPIMIIYVLEEFKVVNKK